MVFYSILVEFSQAVMIPPMIIKLIMCFCWLAGLNKDIGLSRILGVKDGETKVMRLLMSIKIVVLLTLSML